jgi:hypothetical protein
MARRRKSEDVNEIAFRVVRESAAEPIPMEAGISNHVWSISKLVNLLDSIMIAE